MATALAPAAAARRNDTWRIDLNCAFSDPTATRCCSCYLWLFALYENLHSPRTADTTRQNKYQ